MVILISGPSCSGKTLIAQKLMEKYHVTYYSIDHIKMGLIKGLDDCQFTASDGDDEITEKIWPIVKGIITTAIENHQNLIIEGVYMTPQNILEFEARYAKEIMPIFLCFSESYIKAHFESKILKYRNVIEKRIDDEDRGISYFIEHHSKLMNDCKREKLKYFLVDKSFDSTVDQLFDYLDRTINKAIV